MALRLKLTSDHPNVEPQRSVKEFGREGGTIGRSLKSDWVLPDTKRFVSSRHASIDFRSGSYYIVDTSTNGVYVNGADRPVGRGKPQRLFDGDRVRIGDFEILAEIDDESGDTQLIDEDHIDPVDLAQRVEAPEPAGEDLVDAFEMTGVGFEMQLSDEEMESLTAPSRRGEVLVLDLSDGAAKRDGETTRAGRHNGLPDPNGTARTKRLRRRPVARSTQTAAAARQAGDPAPQSVARQQAVTAQQSVPALKAQSVTSVAPQATPRITAAPVPAAGPVPADPRHPARTAATTRSRTLAAPPAAAAPRAPTTPQVKLERPEAAGARAARDPAATASVTRVGDAASALEPFFRGAGIRSQKLDDQQVDAMLLGLGQLMREMIVGLTEILHQRTEQKNTLRVPVSTIEPHDNNPLKVAANVEEALLNLLLRPPRRYPVPVEAVREAFTDIKLHQSVLLRALRGAVEAYIGRLEPEDLEQKFSRGKSGMLANATNKLKYWDLYKDLYQLVASHPPDELPLQFLEDFAQAYQQESERAAAAADPSAAKAS